MPGIDQKLFFPINQQWTSPGLDRAMVTLSSFDIWVPLLCVLIVAGICFGGFRVRATILTALLAVAFTETALIGPLKKLVDRPRPYQAESVRTVKFRKATPKFFAIAKPLKVRFSKPESGPINGRSFPSGHTANNFAVATVFAFFFRRWGWLYFLVAAAVGYSRIYTGSHWPTDVLFSMLLGSAAGGVTLLWAKSFWRRRAPGWFPRLFERYPNLLNSHPSESNLSKNSDSPQ